MATYEELAQGVMAGNEGQVKKLVQELINADQDPLEIINVGLIAGMNVVGARFKAGEMFVPEVLMSARSMNAGLELVRPLIADTDIKSKGKIILGTVKGDMHDIGKKLVAMMIESAGFEVINLGVDVKPEKFVQAIEAHHPDVVGMSALLTTTMLNMKDTIDLLREKGLRNQIKVIVGGAPLSQDFADTIGADGYAPDAASATDLIKNFLGV